MECNPVVDIKKLEFSAPVIKKSELKKLGFSEAYLSFVYRNAPVGTAWKMNPNRPNSHILYNVEKFLKFIDLQSKAKNRNTLKGGK